MAVHEQPRIRPRRVGGDEDVARAAELQQHIALRTTPAAQAEATWSAAPATTGSPSGKPLSAAAAAVTCPMMVWLAATGGSVARRDAGERHQVRRDLPVREVHEARLQRPVVLDHRVDRSASS